MPASTRVEHSSPTRHRQTRGESASVDTKRLPRHAVMSAAAGPQAERQADCSRRSREPLGNHANTAATPGQKADAKEGNRRSDRYRARQWLSTVTGLKRVGRCGRVSVIEGGEVLLKVSGEGENRQAGFGGLSTCGSVWACPVCSAKIAARRTTELEQILTWNAHRGGSVALGTFTMAHHPGQSLKELRKALSQAWRHITASRAWKSERKALGMDHYVRAVECTDGENGWHPHIHLLMLFDGPISQDLVDEFTAELYRLWTTGLAKNGITASREHGVDVRVGTGALDGLGKYLSKLTYEAAGGRFKRGRKGGRTPFELLDDAIKNGLARDFERWFEWEQGSRGMRQLVMSRHLKDEAQVEEVEDEEIAEEDEGGETIARITPTAWRSLYWQAAELLTVAEQGGPEVAMAWMDYRGLGYEANEHLYGPAIP